MSEAAATAQSGGRWRVEPFAMTALVVASLTAVRLVALFATPLELYPDEAQYWSWSRDLAFGYFSKPPLVAWLISATTWMGGNAEPWVRLSAPFLHAGAALALARTGARLYGPWTGFWTAALYALMPGVQLSSGVISTDAPLFLFLSLALWAYAGFTTAEGRRERLWCAAGLGVALGLAWLSKYAALYFLGGLVLHALIEPRARRWRRSELALAAGAFLMLAAPNAVWNATHGFATLEHTLANADWGTPVEQPANWRPETSYDFRDGPGFLLSQFGVFGPIPFAVLLGGTATLWRRRRLVPEDRLLLCFVLPPLLVVLAQAAIARANANWAGPAYCAGSVLAAAWLLRWRARRAIGATLVIQGAVAVVFLAAVVWPGFADRIGLGASFKWTRGWLATTNGILDRAAAEEAAGGLTAVAVDDRFLFNAMTYYGRDRLSEPSAPPLVMWMRRPRAYTQAELEAPLTEAVGGRVLGASLEGVYLGEMMGDFLRGSPAGEVAVRLDPDRTRRTPLFVGEGFRPAPRHPRSGLPMAAAPPLEATP